MRVWPRVSEEKVNRPPQVSMALWSGIGCLTRLFGRPRAAEGNSSDWKADGPAQLDSASAEYAPLATYDLAVCSSAARGRGWSRQDSNVKPLAQDGAFSGTRRLSTDRQATKPRKRSLSRAELKESSSLQQRSHTPDRRDNHAGANDCLRRMSPERLGEGPLTERTAGVQPARREQVLLAQNPP